MLLGYCLSQVGQGMSTYLAWSRHFGKLNIEALKIEITFNR